MTGQPMITFENVDIVFGSDPAAALAGVDAGLDRTEILSRTGSVVGVMGASLQVAQGETCVLMGLSGSGKSTLLRAVNGLNPVSRGRIQVRDASGNHVEVGTCSRRALRQLRRQRVAMVFQQFALLPWRTVRENVALGLELRGTARSERQRIVGEVLEMVGLSAWADHHAHELSGGMQQRVGLARAFATDADILLMDEPFSALDPLIRAHLQDELMRLQQTLKKTLLFVSHDMDEALRLGSHIAILEGGRIVQDADAEAIVLQPANDYVRAFTRHMNPLGVLRARSVMRPVAALRAPDAEGWQSLDRQGRVQVQLDADRRVRLARADGEALELCRDIPEAATAPAGAPDATPTPARVLQCATPDTLLGALVALRQVGGRPVPILADGRLLGVVGDEEIFSGMLLHRQNPSEH